MAGDLSNLLSTDESKHLLIELCAGFSHSTLIIDALDECNSETRGRLFDILQNVVSESKTTRVKAFVTSRDDADLRKKFPDSPNVYIQERDNSSDFNSYIKAEIEACIVEKKLLDGNISSELRDRVIDTLEAGAHGMYAFSLSPSYREYRFCTTLTLAVRKVHMGEIPNRQYLQGDYRSRYCASLDRATNGLE